MFWFGFLAVASYLSIKDKNYGMFILSLVFWLIGFYFLKKKLFNTKTKDETTSKFNFLLIISGGLVIITLLLGIAIVLFGIIQSNMTMIYAGAFFALGSFTFILFALIALGYFDKIKYDVLGIYVGGVFIAMGIGIPAIQYLKTLSISETIWAFGGWILIPLMLVIVGILQVIKCLKKDKF